MIVCERLLGNQRDLPAPLPGQALDAIELPWRQCQHRALRKTSRLTHDVAVFQPPGQVLSHDAVLHESPTLRLTVYVLPTQIIFARPRSAQQLAELAFEIGNLHAPAEITEAEIRMEPDGPIEEILEKMKVPWELRRHHFSPKFAVATVTVSPSMQIREQDRSGAATRAR